MRSRLIRAAELWLPTLALAALVVVANLWAAGSPLRWDLTSGGVYSLSAASRRVIAAVDRPVEITFFYDLRSRAHTDARDLLEQYAALNPLITVHAYEPTLQPAEARRQQVSFAGTSVFESGGRRIVVAGLGETEFTNGLIRAGKQAAQRLCFTDGHVESDPFSLKSHDHIDTEETPGHSHSAGGRPLELHERHGMGMARDALATLGYEVTKVLLAQGPGKLAGCSLVIVASPQRAFLPAETAQLIRHVEGGGRFVLLLEPFAASGLEPVLELFGVTVDPYPVLDDTRHYWTDPGSPAVSSFARHAVTRNLPLVFFPGAAALNPRPGGVPDDVSIVPLAETSPDARVATPADADEPRLRGRRPRTLALLATKRLPSGKEARAFIAGDGDFATNTFFAILGNGQLFLNATNHLAEQEDLLDIAPRNYELPRLRLTNSQMWFTFAVSSVLMPGLMLLAGAVVWRRRR